jgi:cell division protein FtsI (penicillin-binding protein 3)
MASERRPHPAHGRSRASAGSTGRTRSTTAGRSGGAKTAGAGAGRALRPGFTEKPGRRPHPRRRPPVRAKGPLRIPLAHGPKRLRVVLVAMAIALSLCAGRLLQLQGFDSAAYAADSAEQLTRTLPLLPSRGDITDRNGLVMAATEAAVAVTADPVLTAPRATEISGVLTGYLKIDRLTLYTLLTKPKTRFVYLAKKVPALTYSKLAAELTSKKLYGVFRESDPIRTYPGGSVGSTVVGYVNGDGRAGAVDERRAGRGRGQRGLRERPERQQDPAGDQHRDAGQERDQLPADPGLGAAVDGRAPDRGSGAEDPRRLGLRHHPQRQDR